MRRLLRFGKGRAFGHVSRLRPGRFMGVHDSQPGSIVTFPDGHGLRLIFEVTTAIAVAGARAIPITNAIPIFQRFPFGIAFARSKPQR